MLMPKKTKFRKAQRGRLKGLSKGARTVHFGDYGLMALEPVWLTARQIESVRVTINRKLKKLGEAFLRVFPDKPISKKPAETRMGKGKGSPEFWVAPVKRGRVILEIKGNFDLTVAREILQAAAYKLPLKTKVVARNPESAALAPIAK
ncbi:50S ribosomal protein L16 [Candidatus Dependentiae bacterium]|nr:50S ribosomal protein L16 [Candidatus Dependentiae bacterium]